MPTVRTGGSNCGCGEGHCRQQGSACHAESLPKLGGRHRLKGPPAQGGSWKAAAISVLHLSL
eukprot:1159621-Pelagomonas_calceolata.AAC.15